jgi:hypothetical protein
MDKRIIEGELSITTDYEYTKQDFDLKVGKEWSRGLKNDFDILDVLREYDGKRIRITIEELSDKNKDIIDSCELITAKFNNDKWEICNSPGDIKQGDIFRIINNDNGYDEKFIALSNPIFNSGAWSIERKLYRAEPPKEVL